jgi:putative ABC transport system substrate-binding protein
MVAMLTVVRFASMTAVVLLIAGSVAVGAQEVTRVYRIGQIAMASGPSHPAIDAFGQGLRELGYVEGKNVMVEVRFAEGRPERLPEIVADLIGQKVDVLVVGATVSALAAKKATTTVPIVFAYLIDPVASGVVASLAHPGGNITGTSIGVGSSGFAGKWVELIKEAFPYVSHVAIIWNSANPQAGSFMPEIEAAGRTLKVKLELLDAGNDASLDRALATIGASRAQAIIVAFDPFFTDDRNRAKLVQFAAAKRLPAIYSSKLFVDSGGLMTYGPSQVDSFRRAATYVDKILKGAKPADLPVEQPTHFELVINMKTARALGLTIPQALLVRAVLSD